MNYLFLNTNFAHKLRGKCWKDDVVTFTPHLSVTIKRLARYKQKVVLAAILDGKSMPSNMAANTNHTTLLKNQSAIKHLPQMRSISNFGCKIIFMCSVDFWHQQDSNSLFRGSIGHVTSSCKWPIRPTQAVLASHGAIKDYPGNLSQSKSTAGFPPFALSKLTLALPPFPTFTYLTGRQYAGICYQYISSLPRSRLLDVTQRWRSVAWHPKNGCEGDLYIS